MRDENNDINRLDRIEELLEKFAEQSMRNEFNLAAYRKANDERAVASDAAFARMESLQAKTQGHLNYLTQLVGVFGDQIHDLDEKAKKIKEVL